MAKSNIGDEQSASRKAWQPLKLETLQVPSATKSGVNRLDPTESFVLYRPS